MENKIRSFCVCAVSIFLITTGCATHKPIEHVEKVTETQPPITTAEERHFELGGGFSWVPPSNWNLAYPEPFHMAFAPQSEGEDGFTANIQMIEESFPGSVDTYVAVAIADQQKRYPKAELLSNAQLSTGFEHRRSVIRIDRGEDGHCIICIFCQSQSVKKSM